MMKSFIALLLITGVFIFLTIWAAIKEAEQWETFVNENQCIVIGSISGSSTLAMGVGPNGTVTVTPVSIPGKTGWRCRDGMEYWR